MRTSAKVGSFGAGLTLVFGAAFGVGSAVGPIGGTEEPAHGDPHDFRHEGAVHTAEFTVPTDGAPGPETGGHGH